jgi:hypothetical protein
VGHIQSKVQSPSSECNSRSTSKSTFSFYVNRMFVTVSQKPTNGPNSSHIGLNRVHVFSPFISNNNFNIIFFHLRLGLSGSLFSLPIVTRMFKHGVFVYHVKYYKVFQKIRYSLGTFSLKHTHFSILHAIFIISSSWHCHQRQQNLSSLLNSETQNTLMFDLQLGNL